MSRVDLHPEELLDRVRSGTASDEERLRAQAHVANCTACSIEQTFYVQLEQSVAPRSGDDLALARIRTSIHRAVEARARTLAPRPKRWTARRWATLAFAATLLLTTLGAATVLLRERGRAIPTPIDRGQRLHVQEPRESLTQGAVNPTAPPASSENVEDPPPAPRRVFDDSRVPPAAPRNGTKPDRARTAGPTAADLFARANQLRRQDQAGEAATVYRELQRSFPGTAEEVASRVVLGRLLLDRLGDAHAALTQFDSYLAHPAPGSLREEALIGRAIALGRLGRSAEERLAWSALLEAYPRSTYAPRARSRTGAPGEP
jgi:hypothetical protein